MSDDGIPARTDSSDITSLSVKYTPSSCYIGETPWSFGTLVINNKTEVSITRDMVSGFDNTSAHTCQITVTYKGRQTSYLLPVVAPKTSDITSLQISAKPSRLSYTEGDLFNPSGVSFFATIGGRYAYIYSGYTYDKTRALTSSDTEVTFDYFGAKVTQKISVAANTTNKTEYSFFAINYLSFLQYSLNNFIVHGKVISSQSAHVLNDNGSNVSDLNLIHHLNEAWAIKSYTGKYHHL